MSLVKTYAVILSGTVVIAVATVTGFYILSGIPKYAIHEINKSMDKRDWKEFSKYVEVDSIVAESYQTFAAYNEANSKEIAAVPNNSFLSSELLAMVEPQVKEIMKKELKYFVEHGKSDEASPYIPRDKSIESYKKTFNDNATLKGYKRESLDDTSAVFAFNFESSEGLDMAVKIRLRKFGHQWKLVSVMNLGELIVKLDKIKKKKARPIPLF